jgi:hypothetical protein
MMANSTRLPKKKNKHTGSTLVEFDYDGKRFFQVEAVRAPPHPTHLSL